MTINEYISMLDDIRDGAEKLSDLTSLEVSVDFTHSGIFELAAYNANGDRVYFVDYYPNELERMRNHINSMVIGVMLATGKEI